MSGPDGAERTAPALPERYRDLGRIGIGGGGEVRRVWDGELDRPLAMKILHPDGLERDWTRWRFDEETRVTARLQHPGVVPVHDRGELADGRPWYTMKEIAGKTLGEAIRELHAVSTDRGWGTAPLGGLRWLVSVFEATCQVLAYAHEQGVIHRDVKPDNVLVGPFGEVYVLDWGIARAASDPDVDPDAFTAGGSALTRDGTVLGSPRYMAPEQATGDVERQGPHTDVYGLGATLYELLCGAPPYDGDGLDVWQQVLSGPPPDLATRGGPPVPDELAELVRWTMAREAAERPASVGPVIAALRSWMDGARARELALARVAESDELAGRPLALRADAERLKLTAATLLRDVKPWEGEERKAPAWDLEAHAERLLVDAALAEAACIQRLYDALGLAPDLPEAHERLADHWRSRLEEAEARHDVQEATRNRALLETHDRAGRHRAWLRGDARVVLASEPAGARVTLHRFVERHRRWVPDRVGELGVTPIETQIAPGSWLLTLEAEGRAEVRVPVWVGRLGTFENRSPDGAPVPVVLPPAGALGPDDRVVPAGWFVSGGTPVALDALPRRDRWVDGLVVKRFPVTWREYLAFLEDLRRRGREDDALRAAPSELDEGRVLVDRAADGSFSLGVDLGGHPWHPDAPVVYVDWHGANAYAAWRAERDRLPWRLPHDEEWEKAARGVDGRAAPWGDRLDPAWCNMQHSTAGRPDAVPVAGFPVDESVYGVRGCAGNVREWCANLYRREPEPGAAVDPSPQVGDGMRVIRGGSYGSSADRCWLAGRFAAEPGQRLRGLGFRLVRSWP